MKKTTKVVLGSVMTMAMCASLIAGSTLALFTSEDSVNIAITSGKVDVKASLEELQTYVPDVDPATGLIKREDGKIVYKKTTENGQFDIVGGSAKIEDGTVTFENFAPMDRVTFNITAQNAGSTIAAKYQTRVEVTYGYELYSALEVKVGEALIEQGTAISDWKTLSVGTNESVPVEITFPEDAGEDPENKNCKITVSVIAVQANADTKDPEKEEGVSYAVRTPADLAVLAQRVNNGKDFAGETVKLYEDVDLSNIYPWTPIGTQAHPFNGIFDGNGKTISGAVHTGRTEFIDNVGLFGYTGEKTGGEIKNFTYQPKGNKLMVMGSNYGYIVGYAKHTTISDITFEKTGGSANVEAMYVKNSAGDRVYTDMENIGMIAGYSMGIIKNCHVNTDSFSITGEPYHEGWDDKTKGTEDHLLYNVGGIVGCIEGGSVSNCSVIGINLGQWYSAPSSRTLYTAVAGGIVGYLYASAGADHYGIDSCYVEYNTTKNYEYLAGRDNGSAPHIGGIVGWVTSPMSEDQQEYLKIEKNFFKAKGIKDNANPIIGANYEYGNPQLVANNFGENGWKIEVDNPADQTVENSTGAELSIPITLTSSERFAGVTDYASFLAVLESWT